MITISIKRVINNKIKLFDKNIKKSWENFIIKIINEFNLWDQKIEIINVNMN